MEKKYTYISPIGDDGIYVLNTASWRTVRPVMDKEICVNCGMCLAFCPVNSIVGTEDGQFVITYDYCKGCGICANECRVKAITMVPEGGAE